MWRYMIVWLIAVSHAWILLNKWSTGVESFRFKECSLLDLIRYFLIHYCNISLWLNDCMLGANCECNTNIMLTSTIANLLNGNTLNSQ